MLTTDPAATTAISRWRWAKPWNNTGSPVPHWLCPLDGSDGRAVPVTATQLLLLGGGAGHCANWRHAVSSTDLLETGQGGFASATRLPSVTAWTRARRRRQGTPIR